MTNLSELRTPCLVLDRTKLLGNIDRMKAKADLLGVGLRPHLKTAKSIDVARFFDVDEIGITVSTIREAEYFADSGISKILYGVSIVASKLERIAAIYARGARVQLILDSLDTARAVAAYGAANGITLDVLIEIDTDGHRAGLDPEDPAVLEIGRLLFDSDAINFIGVMTHAGESYECATTDDIVEHAEQERALCVRAAKRLGNAGIDCPIVSVGSTPTCTFAQNLDGITDMRPGNFVFFDLFQAGLGVCTVEDIAVSVLCTVLGHDRAHKRFFTDAGGMALSKDRSTASQELDQQFGVLMTEDGSTVLDNYIVVGANQEHGVISTRNGSAIDFARFPIGSRVRVLPNHSCMTAAAYERYHVTDGGTEIAAEWERCNGW